MNYLMDRLSFWIVLLVALICGGAEAFGEAQKFLIVSAPGTSRIAYLKLPADGSPAVPGEAFRTLIDKELVFPQGIAVDAYRKRLFVADPNLGKLVMYPLSYNGDKLSVGKMVTVAKGVEVRAVAVDGLGNVVFSEETTNRIMRVTAPMIEAGDTTAQTIYSGDNLSAVSAPGGVAVDNYFVYWLNKNGGTKVGSLVRAQRSMNLAAYSGNVSSRVSLLSSNAAKCYGVCIALGNAFYTDETKNLYGISRASTARSNAITISSALKEPRGCAFDGAGTVYVTDKGQNAIFQFASNMQTLTPDRPLTKAADLQGAFGIVVYTPV
ncbi:unnamed protein product [Polarella glacialis]|uniref:SMP-30/Gluconolactonase/LRE-like region domain-containing protein n=2 Tax=Polarella glacialis TaxID=89957 RepID=A0A813LUR2_POLGL|nr:unnamed protein product [Polarella glacialis]CAE8743986.1 unnamed protein product [Polarella glacialis]